MDVPITIGEAMRGAKIRLETLGAGAVQVSIPPGTSSGKTLRLRGQGIERRGAPTGDLYAHLKIEVPSDADLDALAAAIDAIDAAYTKPPRG